jgi:hypothetical protein
MYFGAVDAGVVPEVVSVISLVRSDLPLVSIQEPLQLLSIREAVGAI